ncbi:MAG: F0F1 ATP synthase subunit delta [Candidatus Saccharibacteria bacterium]|nr:F0F1 ATP synthase subunit delta [Candidatus Saccharibacteria bacterium]
MAGAISRRKVAAAIADQLLAGDTKAISRLAAYLIDTKQTRMLDVVVRDIESALLERGVLVADVTSAHDLTDALQRELTTFLQQQTQAKTVQLRTSVDERLIGGLRVATPNATLDTSIKTKLQQLKAAKQ